MLKKREKKLWIDIMRRKTTKEFIKKAKFIHENKYDYSKVNCHKAFGKLYEELTKKFIKLNGLGYSIYYMWESDWNSWNKGNINTFPIKKYNEDKI